MAGAAAEPAGLLSHWPFEEEFGAASADVIGDREATLVGDILRFDGVFGRALDFFPDSYAQVDDPSSGALDFTETQSFSFGAWIRPDMIDNTGRPFFSKRDGAGFELGVWSGSMGVFAEVSDGAIDRSTADFHDIPIPLHEWTHVMAVVNRDDSTLRFYINGVETEALLDLSGLGSLANGAPLEFGRASGDSARGFDGAIDEVRIYNRALTPEEVMAVVAMKQTVLEFAFPPMNTSTTEGLSPLFLATVRGTPPFYAQWFRNGAAIEGATNLLYRVENATREMSGDVYTLTVSNLYPSAITSGSAILTVDQERTPPAVINAFSRVPTEVIVTFNEPVTAASSELISNYLLKTPNGNAIPIATASLDPLTGAKVTLLLNSALLEGALYHLEVAGVQDLAPEPNTIAPTHPTSFYHSTLVGYWSLNQNEGTVALDHSFYANSGVLVGGPTWVQGKSGNALMFDGVDDYVDLGDPANGSLDFRETDSFSFGAFIKPVSMDTNGRRILSKRDSDDVGYEFSIINRNGHGVFAELGDLSFAPSSYDAGVQIPLELDRWYHVMNVVDRSTGELRIYLDGELQGAVDISFLGSLEVDVPLNFGRASGSNNSAGFFAGAIDEIRIYSRALTGQEIRALIPPDIHLEFTSVTLSPGNLQLNWSGDARLESAPALLGPWEVINEAPVPPLSIPVIPGENRFFRLSTILP